MQSVLDLTRFLTLFSRKPHVMGVQKNSCFRKPHFMGVELGPMGQRQDLQRIAYVFFESSTCIV